MDHVKKPLADLNPLQYKIRAADERLTDAEKNLRHTVLQVHDEGCTWAEIGEALGTTRQAAWERFARDRKRTR